MRECPKRHPISSILKRISELRSEGAARPELAAGHRGASRSSITIIYQRGKRSARAGHRADRKVRRPPRLKEVRDGWRGRLSKDAQSRGACHHPGAAHDSWQLLDIVSEGAKA